MTEAWRSVIGTRESLTALGSNVNKQQSLVFVVGKRDGLLWGLNLAVRTSAAGSR
jgi:hypothetical protein